MRTLKRRGMADENDPDFDSDALHPVTFRRRRAPREDARLVPARHRLRPPGTCTPPPPHPTPTWTHTRPRCIPSALTLFILAGRGAWPIYPGHRPQEAHRTTLLLGPSGTCPVIHTVCCPVNGSGSLPRMPTPAAVHPMLAPAAMPSLRMLSPPGHAD